MKKLLSFLVAGIAALGLASCSGDLHNEFDPSSALGKLLLGDGTVLDKADICGTFNNWTGSALTKEEDGTYTYTFTADATSGQFSIREVAGSWTAGNRWCGALKQDDENALKLKNGKSVTLVYSDDPNPSHVQLPELTVGTSYTLTFTIEDDDSISAALSSGGAAVLPVPYVLSGYYVRGQLISDWNTIDIDNALFEFTTDSDGNVTYKIDFTAPATVGQFVLASKDWNEKIGGTDSDGNIVVKCNDDYVKLEGRRTGGGDDGAKNIGTSGITAGDTYRLYIKTTPKKEIFAKVVSLSDITVSGATVTVTGLPDSANGKTLYFTGSFNEWKTPGDTGTITATVESNSVSISLPNFNKKFEGSEAQEFSVEAKFASTGWTKPEICAKEDGKGANAKFVIKASKKSVKAVYKETITISGNPKASENGDQYICEWTVE